MPIQINNITRRFGKKLALDDVTLSIKDGERFGILGPNGAGKSTLISILTTLRRPTSGRITIDGKDIEKNGKETRRKLGVIFQECLLDEDLTARDNLLIHAMLYKMDNGKKIDSLLNLVGLDKEKGKVKTFSGGMQRRLEIARGLINEPEILILDEPTLGLDPIAKYAIWEHILKTNAKGTTIIVATNDMLEAERLCTRIALINNGKIILCESLPQIKKKHKTIEKMFLTHANG